MCSHEVPVIAPPLLLNAIPTLAESADDPRTNEIVRDEHGRILIHIDACIAPAVRALWDAGVVTLAACCGHVQPGEDHPWGVISIQTKPGADQRGATVLRRERYEALLAAEAANDRCTNLTNAEASRIFEEAREQRERAERAEQALAEAREDLEAKKLTIARASAYLGEMHLHSSPGLRWRQIELAEQTIKADCDDTIRGLVIDAGHLEWVAEMVARGEVGESTQKTAAICLERFRNGVKALVAAQPATAGAEGEAGTDGG